MQNPITIKINRKRSAFPCFKVSGHLRKNDEIKAASGGARDPPQASTAGVVGEAGGPVGACECAYVYMCASSLFCTEITINKLVFFSSSFKLFSFVTYSERTLSFWGSNSELREQGAGEGMVCARVAVWRRHLGSLFSTISWTL